MKDTDVCNHVPTPVNTNAWDQATKNYHLDRTALVSYVDDIYCLFLFF